MISLIPRAAGIYVLVLLVEAPLKIHVGSLGYITITRGKYVYLGSARGPGGLLARINRHYSKRKKLRWHIDYLTVSERVRIIGVVYAITWKNLENSLYRELIKMGFTPYIYGFGSSEYKLKEYSHLLRFSGEADIFKIISNAMTNLGLKPVRLRLMM